MFCQAVQNKGSSSFGTTVAIVGGVLFLCAGRPPAVTTGIKPRKARIKTRQGYFLQLQKIVMLYLELCQIKAKI